VNVLDPKQSQEVYELLTENYVEDDDAMFRFDYSVNALDETAPRFFFFLNLYLCRFSMSNAVLQAVSLLFC